MVCHTTTFGAPGRGLSCFSSSLARLHGRGGRRGDDGGCGVIRATRLSPSCPRGNRARGAATVGSGARRTSARVRAHVKGPLTSCERRSDKSQLAAYLTHVRKARSGGKPTPVAPSPLRRKADSGHTKPAPAEIRLRSHQTRSGGKPTPVTLSRLRSHPRLYISVSPTLRGPAGNKIFSFVTR